MGLLFRRHDEQDSTGADDDAGDDRRSTITPGVPGRCPECDGFGYIDHADLVHHTQMQHCRDCGHQWEYQFDADGVLVEMLDPRAHEARPEKIGYVDLTDGAAPTVRAQPSTGRSGPGRPAGEADEDIYDKSPGEWLRGIGKS